LRGHFAAGERERKGKKWKEKERKEGAEGLEEKYPPEITFW